MLHAAVGLRIGSLALQAQVDAAPGQAVAVVGPNGAGKSTLLRALAGLVPLDAGKISLGEQVLADAGRGVHLEPERRPVGFAFQGDLLFPHLSALDNVAYGLRARGAGRREARRRAGEWLDRLGLADAAAERPAALSGGQAQRVALARALATEPALLLLDEPLSALDVGARARVRAGLRADLAGSDGVRMMVTHDPVDAMALADRVLVLEDGRVTQDGTMTEVTTRPRSAWAARLVGLNLYRGTVDGGRLVVAGGGTLAVATDLAGPVVAVVQPRSVVLHRTRPAGSARNVWPGQAAGVDVEGHRVRVEVRGSPDVVAEVTAAAAAELRLAEGGPVWVSVKATEIDVQRDG